MNDEKETKVDQKPISSYNKRRGAVIRVVKDEDIKAEAKIRFDKKTGLFYSEVKGIDYSCLEIKPLERVVRGLLASLVDIWFVKIISVEAFDGDEDNYYSSPVKCEKPSLGWNSSVGVLDGISAFSFSTFWIGQNNSSLRTYVLADEDEERAKKVSGGEESIKAEKMNHYCQHWSRPDEDGKVALIFPTRIGGSHIMLYDDGLWNALNYFKMSLEQINLKLQDLIQPAMLEEFVKVGKFPALTSGVVDE